MSRPVCHLELGLTPVECGELLSRVRHAEQLEELSLRIYLVRLGVHSTGTCVHVVECIHVLLHVCLSAMYLTIP